MGKLTAIILLSSSAALAVELSAARLLAPLVGMSLFTWTAIITVVLTGFSIGHWIGGIVASKVEKSGHAERWLAFALAWAGLSVVAAIAALPLAPGIIAVSGGVKVTTVLILSAVLFLVPSLAAGVVSPLATAIAIDRSNSQYRGAVLARMFAASAAGAILGVLGTGYILVPVLGAAGALWLVAVLQSILGVWIWQGAGAKARLVLATVLAVGGIVAGSPIITRSACDAESQYYCLIALDTTALTGFASRGLKIDGWLHSVEDVTDQDRLFIESHDFVDNLVRREKGGLSGLSALFIGGGGLTLPELWRRDGQASRLWVLEIDPAVTRFASDHLDVRVEDPLRVIHADGRAGMRGLNAGVRFDVIYNDAYTGLTMPTHLVTQEFHLEVRGRLREQGLYIVNLIDAPRDPRFLASLVRTLGEGFKNVEVWRRQGSGRGNRRMHYGVVAKNRPSDFSILLSRSDPTRIWERLDPPSIRRLFDGTSAMILRDDLAPVDRLLANFCSLAFLHAFSVSVTRGGACQ